MNSGWCGCHPLRENVPTNLGADLCLVLRVTAVSAISRSRMSPRMSTTSTHSAARSLRGAWGTCPSGGSMSTSARSPGKGLSQRHSLLVTQQASCGATAVCLRLIAACGLSSQWSPAVTQRGSVSSHAYFLHTKAVGSVPWKTGSRSLVVKCNAVEGGRLAGPCQGVPMPQTWCKGALCGEGEGAKG